MRNENVLKMCVSEIHVKQMRINQGISLSFGTGDLFWPCFSGVSLIFFKRSFDDVTRDNIL